MTKEKTNKIDHVWSIICTNSSTDTKTNNISLFNLVEKYTVVLDKKSSEQVKKQKKGNFIIPFNQQVITRFRKNIRNTQLIVEMTMDIITPSKKVIKGNEINKIVLPKEFTDMRVVNRVGMLPIEGKGLHMLSIKIREVGEDEFEEVGLVPLDIDIKLENNVRK